MSLLFSVLLIAHICSGAASLALFWIPVFARKGGKNHIRSGHWYAQCMYVVAISALLLCVLLLIDPISIKYADANLSPEQVLRITAERRGAALFLLAISVLVISNVRHGLLTLKDNQHRSHTRSVNHTALNISLGTLAIILAFVGYQSSVILFYVFAVLCAVTAVGNLRYAWRAKVSRSDRIRSHLGSMIGAGIGSHTAFFVFGANRFMAGMLPGNLQMIPWLLPGVVGGIIITILSRRYTGSRRTKTVN